MSSLSLAWSLLCASLREIGASVRRARAFEWVALATFVLVVAILYVVKARVQAAIEIPDNSVLRFANAAGGGWPLTAFGVTLFIVGAVASERAKRAAIVFGVAGIFCFIVVRVGGFVLAESRPRDGGAMHFFAFGGHGISGHANAAALLLFPIRDILAARSSRRTRAVITIVFVSWALFIGWSRVAMGMHHAWNVVLGWAFGFYVSRVVTAMAARDPRA